MHMLTISKPLSAGQARAYHHEEYSNAQENYYSQGDRIRDEWHGKLAEKWGLRGGVQEEQFRRLSDGQHPITGEQLVRYQTAREYANEHGKTVKAMEHRAGWDATFSAPKSVSLTALVGGDERVQEAHRASVELALDAMERYVQARLGGNLPPETTRNWVAAKFEHDSARPVNGYAAPQLHTHVVFFNLTETENGETRPLQPQELYRTQQYATAVYRSELAHHLQELGYEIEHGKSGQPEIKGYSREYLDASSPRRKQIEAHLAVENQGGAAAAQNAAHQTREPKIELSHEEMQRRHQDMALDFGDQPKRVMVEAKERAYDLSQDSRERIAHSARENPHLDHGYAVTSHSSQGQTADRVLIDIDTEQGGEKLVNRRLAYVAVSRGRYDAQIYTNDKTALAEGLGRDVSHRSALESTRAAEPRSHKRPSRPLV
jgi:conjugative relaxase-like TrwC/TraI family protein